MDRKGASDAAPLIQEAGQAVEADPQAAPHAYLFEEHFLSPVRGYGRSIGNEASGLRAGKQEICGVLGFWKIRLMLSNYCFVRL